MASALLFTVAVIASGCGAATTTSTTSPTTSVVPTGTLGPQGYGSLKLGMSYADALSTGQLEGKPQAGWAVKDHPDAEVCLTKAGGLMAIFGDATMATPERIHLGSTLAEVKAAYPNLKRAVDFEYVPLSATTGYEFLIDFKKKKVYQWNLSTRSETCFN